MKQILAFTLTAILLALTACSGGTGSGSTQPDLNGTAWLMASINGQPIFAGTKPSLAFADGQVSGNGSCNSFGGEYTQKGDQLTFGQLVSTMMACVETEVMDQESAYFAALSATASFRSDSATLSLLDADGNVLAEFTAMVE